MPYTVTPTSDIEENRIAAAFQAQYNFDHPATQEEIEARLQEFINNVVLNQEGMAAAKDAVSQIPLIGFASVQADMGPSPPVEVPVVP